MGPEATAPEIHTLSRNITKLMEEKTRLGWVTSAIALYKREIWIAYTDLGSSENDRCLWMHADFRGWSDWTNMPINAFFTDNKSGTDKLFGVSTVDGYVYVMDAGNQDDGTNITSKVRTKYFDFGRGRARKNLSKIPCRGAIVLVGRIGPVHTNQQIVVDDEVRVLIRCQRQAQVRKRVCAVEYTPVRVPRS